MCSKQRPFISFIFHRRRRRYYFKKRGGRRSNDMQWKRRKEEKEEKSFSLGCYLHHHHPPARPNINSTNLIPNDVPSSTRLRNSTTTTTLFPSSSSNPRLDSTRLSGGSLLLLQVFPISFHPLLLLSFFSHLAANFHLVKRLDDDATDAADSHHHHHHLVWSSSFLLCSAPSKNAITRTVCLSWPLIWETGGVGRNNFRWRWEQWKFSYWLHHLAVAVAISIQIRIEIHQLMINWWWRRRHHRPLCRVGSKSKWWRRLKLL